MKVPVRSDWRDIADRLRHRLVQKRHSGGSKRGAGQRIKLSPRQNKIAPSLWFAGFARRPTPPSSAGHRSRPRKQLQNRGKSSVYETGSGPAGLDAAVPRDADVLAANGNPAQAERRRTWSDAGKTQAGAIAHGAPALSLCAVDRSKSKPENRGSTTGYPAESIVSCGRGGACSS